MNCPHCGDECLRDEVDVGVGVIFGPFGCPSCGWSERPEYDCRNGQPPAAADYPDHIVDQWGGATPLSQLAAVDDLLEQVWDRR